MIFRLLYSLVLAIASPILLYVLYRSKPGKPTFGSRWKEHFGITPMTHQNNPIWVHAVSVGEVIAAIPIIRAIKHTDPERHIIVTTTTSTGARQVAGLGELVEHRYMPIDFQWCVQGFIKAIQPSKLLIMETELWPNTLHAAFKAKIPILVLNARLSERSRSRYSKVKPIFNLLSKPLNKVLCQYPDDAQRFIDLGVDGAKVVVTGSVKFDIQVTELDRYESNGLRLMLGNQRPVWIAASTHSGEDEPLLKAHKEVLISYPTALLILVPRHPERFSAVYELCTEQGFTVTKRTSPQSLESCQVYLGDTMGEMMTLLGASDVCFMGGSLLGDKVGGHNLLEPAALALPLLNGPSYYNFTTVTQKLLDEHAVTIVHDYKAVAEKVTFYFGNKKLATEVGLSALRVVENNRGALLKTVAHVLN